MIITNSCFKTSTWNGGTTTELFIYPHDSSYQARNFDIRISSATVDVEESLFTNLPNYNRALMILSGDLVIHHESHYTKMLSQYDCDYFDGAWNTSAKGKVIDFNLMTSKNLTGTLIYQKLSINHKLTLSLPPNQIISGIYLISGQLLITDTKQDVNPQELIIIDNPKDTANISVIAESQIIMISVNNFII
ncbi:HutD family protein [bacterium]|nr:HutD family protein [bacterium]